MSIQLYQKAGICAFFIRYNIEFSRFSTPNRCGKFEGKKAVKLVRESLTAMTDISLKIQYKIGPGRKEQHEKEIITKEGKSVAF